MRQKNMKRSLSILLIFLLTISLIPPNSSFVSANSEIPKNGKDDSIDPNLKMITGKQWKDNVEGRPGATGAIYTVEHPSQPDVSSVDYMNDMNYYISVGGFNQNKVMPRKNHVGLMPLLRPLKNGGAGRLFTQPKDLPFWTLNFNGNSDYVSYQASLNTVTITENGTSNSFKRLYIRDLLQWSGASFVLESSGIRDEGLGNEFAGVVVTTTSYPDAEIEVPSRVEVNENVMIKYSGKEFYPDSFFSTRKYIGYELTINGELVDRGSKLENTFDLQKDWVFKEEGTYDIELTVTDKVSRSFTAKKRIVVGEGGVIVPEEPNIPPIAEVSVRPFYYWPEAVDISTISYDIDGEIVSEELFVDGSLINGNIWSSPRVTKKTPHSVYFRNQDDRGDIGEAYADFEILPTTPEADYRLQGELKANRAIVIDSKASDLVSPVHVAPIDYNRTSFNIVPVSEGLTNEDIKIRPSSDPSIRQVLFKKPGKYELHLTVTNIFDETSEVLVSELEVRPDEKPVAAFTVDKSVYLRDASDIKNTSITLTDESVSFDGDTIGQRIWYVEFDANNDGVFGTAADGGKQVISSGNETRVTYKNSHVGHYRFSLEVKENFGEPTYEEFILPEDYLIDKSDVIDENGSISVYMNPDNFNKPMFDKAIKIDNVPPVIDFDVKRKNSVQLVLDFGGMDIASLNHKGGSRAGGGINNGGGGGSFNHYYYDIDQNDKNRLTAYAGSLEIDLRMKGIDATVNINNCYYHLLDLDGECVTNVPVWGDVDFGNYAYSSYSGTSPYSGSWEVTSSSSSPIMTVTGCLGKPPDCDDCPVVEHPPPCQYAENAVYSQTGTNYTASLRQWQSDWRFVVTHHVSQGCGPDGRPGHPTSDPTGIDEKIDTTDFTSDFRNYNFSDNTYNYYFRMDKNRWTWRNDVVKRTFFANKINTDNVFFWSNSDESLRLDAQLLLSSAGMPGSFTKYNTLNFQSNIQTLRDEILNRFMIEENAESFTIVLGDELDYTAVYEDFENDPEWQREWKFVHDPTSVNGRVIDKQPTNPIPQSGLYISSPMQLNEVGTYTVTLRAKDNPLSDTGNDSRFSEYRKWSDEEIVREYKINVHRRPIADFTAQIEAGTLKLTLDPSNSFDPDHENNWIDLGIAENGIVEYTWEKYVVDNIEYSGKPPATLQPLKDYYVTLTVKDIDGAYGTTTKLVTTKNVNLKPVALFDSPSVVLRGDILNNATLNSYIRDRSYDPNGDDLTNYNWTIKRQNDGAVLWSSSNPPASFSAAGLPVGQYLLGLTVWDIPKFPPTLQSDLFEREITVLNNNAPNSCFELSRVPISLASIVCTEGMTSPHTLYVDDPAIYTDKSTDPDGHELINYSWTVEKLNELNQVTESWNTGSAPIDFNQFGGIGRYRVTQTVFDSPPSPLPSLSGSYSRIFNIVRGPQAPYAMFDYDPLIPIQGDTINLFDKSYDEDGNIVQWQWTIIAPNGATSTQIVENPKIVNAQVGTYTVSLHVWDDTSPTRLRSVLPAIKNIVVKAAPPKKPPVPQFIWEPFKPFLGDSFVLNPDSSYDLDGVIVSYSWVFRSKEGIVTNSNQRYPSITASSEYYDVTLTVRDNDSLSSSLTERININIAKLTPLVTHTGKWKEYWVLEGHDPDTQSFLAGEEFVIKLKTTPAQRVSGEVDFGGDVGKIVIPSNQFKLINTSQFEYEWEALLWNNNFEQIKEGEYVFNFKGYHPNNNPTVESDGHYIIEIVGSVYDVLNYHQSY